MDSRVVSTLKTITLTPQQAAVKNNKPLAMVLPKNWLVQRFGDATEPLQFDVCVDSDNNLRLIPKTNKADQPPIEEEV